MPADAVPVEIDCRSVKQKLDAGEKFLLLDVREPGEYETAKIVGATLIPMSELTARKDELEAHREGPIVVHCHHGGRSLRVVQWLRQNGFQQAQNMTGGIHRWSLDVDPQVPQY
jgi:rhodanese-related sulfurtransferase